MKKNVIVLIKVNENIFILKGLYLTFVHGALYKLTTAIAILLF